MRRIWLWKNRLISSFFLLLVLPFSVYSLVSLSFKNIMGKSLSGMPYEFWVIPGLVFIISSLGLYPLIYRDFFDLRIHRKVLINVALAPYRKRALIGGYLCVAGMEALMLGIVSLLIMSGLATYPLTMIETVVMFLCLMVYLFFLGNYFITLGLAIDTQTTLFLMTALSFIFILFGNGYLIEFGFFPIGVETFLTWQPLSIPFRIFQVYFRTGIMDWALLTACIVLGILWTLANTIILKRKLIH